MLSLSVETSCDDTSVAIVDDSQRVCSMCTISQVSHALYGGVVPEVASRFHEANISLCTRNALLDANMKLSQIDLVSVTVCPGLAGPLLVGGSFAKGLSLGLNIPIVGVNHVEAHAISSIIENTHLSPPFLSLVISGGHTSVIDVMSYSEFKTYAMTRDDAVGEVLDKIARALGFPYPGGATLDKIAIENGRKSSFIIPNPKFENYDFSFSGIKTWGLNVLKKISNNEINDFISSFVFGICDYVCDTTIRIALKLNRNKIALGGGVASSISLRKTFLNSCAKNNIELYTPSPRYCADNAAMIGLLGIYNFKYNKAANLDINDF